MADLSLVEVRRALAAGELSAVEVTGAALERGERFAGYNLFITALPEQVREAAAAADRAWETDGPCGPLHGVPITVKDNIDVAGLPTTAGSPVFADRVATTDAPVVTQLRQAGAIVLGKTNLHELALGGTTMNPSTAPSPTRGNLSTSRAAPAAGRPPALRSASDMPPSAPTRPAPFEFRRAAAGWSGSSRHTGSFRSEA
ncbi:hypothetical protein GCM10009608_80870 [Pseudonocardia alaniniphila]